MLKHTGRILKRSLAAAALIAWIGLIALWIRSYWREDLIVRAYPREISSTASELSKYDILTLVWFAGDGGVCLAARHQVINLARSSDLAPYEEWITWKDLEYPHPTTWPVFVARVSSPAYISYSFRWLPYRPSPIPFAGNGGNQPAPWWEGMAEPFVTPATGPLFAAATFKNLNPEVNSDDVIHIVVFPYWSAFATLSVIALIPTLQFRRWLARRRRDNKGLCPSCGYDLRATPERCPECGAVPASVALQPKHA